MTVRVICSPVLEKKIMKQLSVSGIKVDEDASLTLVERGQNMPLEGVSIVFDSLDYMEVVEMVEKLNVGPDNGSEILLGYYKDRYAIIQPDQVLYIEAQGNQVTCITSKETYYLKKPLYYYEAMLEVSNFIRINKSQLVNMVNVVEIIPWFNSRLVLNLNHGDLQVEVSKKYSKILRRKLSL